ncbi:unnamed protein product [marine sediment metagenome]|uniref:Uncharacterized protein n=1 Tax=marine sediment metagenome TaxID=412755 RepID=X1EBF7_9ZZZZ
MDTVERIKAFAQLYAKPLIDGKHIIDELCSCGHSRFDHLDSFSLGHGACAIVGCPCRQFTWVKWLTK